MSLVNKMLVLLFALVAISHGWKGIVAGVSYEFLEFYDIILKEDSTMTAHQHASWAQGVHMGGSNEPYIDESFGLVEMIDERSYRFITYLNTIAIIRDHPDVSEVTTSSPHSPCRLTNYRFCRLTRSRIPSGRTRTWFVFVPMQLAHAGSLPGQIAYTYRNRQMTPMIAIKA